MDKVTLLVHINNMMHHAQFQGGSVGNTRSGGAWSSRATEAMSIWVAAGIQSNLVNKRYASRPPKGGISYFCFQILMIIEKQVTQSTKWSREEDYLHYYRHIAVILSGWDKSAGLNSSQPMTCTPIALP